MKTTVIIDDDESMRHSLAWLLKSWCYEVRCYDSASRYLSETAGRGKPACVILDIHMPQINGVELYALLKKQYPDISVIFVTGYPSHELAEKARRLDAKGFFSKPIDTDALLHCVAASTTEQ